VMGWLLDPQPEEFEDDEDWDTGAIEVLDQ
jgi:hypothetical protein